MLHAIGDYLFDADRLLLYEKSLSEDARTKLSTLIPKNDHYNSDIAFLKNGLTHQESMQHRTIQYAGILLNGNCGLRCNYCSQSSSEDFPFNLSNEDIIAFVRNILKKRIIAGIATRQHPSLILFFTGGGEPTYDWHTFKSSILSIEELAQHSDVSLSLRLTTNGMLNDKQIEFIGKHFESVLVSYDGMPDIQNKNRPTPSKGNTSNIVEHTIAQLSSSSVKTTIRSTVWHTDFIYLKEMAKFIIERFPKLSTWDINPVTPAGRALDIIQRNSQPLKSQNFVDNYMELVNFIKNIPSDLKVSTPLFSAEPIGFNCGGVGVNVISEWLRMDGKITTCSDTSDIYTEIGKVENGKVIYYDSFDDPLLNSGVKKYQECKDCISFRVCGGGCPLKHIRESMHPLGIINWECSMQCEFWKMILSKLATEDNFDSNFGWIKVRLSIPSLEQYKIYQLKYTL